MDNNTKLEAAALTALVESLRGLNAFDESVLFDVVMTNLTNPGAALEVLGNMAEALPNKGMTNRNTRAAALELVNDHLGDMVEAGWMPDLGA